jgi:predicted transcriptional regulator
MTVKDIAKQVIDTLPDEASMDDIMYALYVRAKFERGEREIREGKGVSHEEAKKRLQKWVM